MVKKRQKDLHIQCKFACGLMAWRTSNEDQVGKEKHVPTSLTNMEHRFQTIHDSMIVDYTVLDCKAS